MAAPVYTPTTWVDLSTLVNAANLNHIETGVKAQSDYLATVETRLAAEEAQPDVPTVVNGQWLKGSGGALVFAGITEADVANLVSDLAAKIATSIVTAKGDLITATGSALPARQGVGANNTLLVADSAQTNGIKWAQVADAMILAGSNLAKLSAVTGTPTGAKFLRDDGSWQTPAGGGGTQTLYQQANQSPAVISTTGMLGMGAVFTPATTRCVVMVAGSWNNSSAGNANTAQIRYGTGSAPGFGAATTGTAVGPIGANAAGANAPFALMAIITGLTASTQIWLDLGIVRSAGSITITNAAFTAFDL